MIPARAVLLGSLALAAPIGAAAQVRGSLAAGTRFGDTPTTGWLGLALQLGRDRWGLDLRSAGTLTAPGFGLEAALAARSAWPLSPSTGLGVQWRGAVDRWPGAAAAAEVLVRGGLQWRSGTVRFDIGPEGLQLVGRDGRLFAGGVASASVQLGNLTLSGEFGELVGLVGGAASVRGAVAGSDTLGPAPGERPRSLSHLGLGVTWARRRLELVGRLRHRSQVTPGEGLGWEAGVSFEPISGMRLEARAGMAPAFAGLFLPHRRRLVLGVELAVPRGRAAASVESTVTIPLSGSFNIEAGEGGMYAIEVRHPSAEGIEIAGDFSDWLPLRLRMAGAGIWRIDLPLAPGMHLVNVRFDGGGWRVPAGLSDADDGFGGRAGVFIIQ